MTTKPQNKEHYVNNASLLDAFVVWKKEAAIAETLGNAPPQVPTYVAECLLKIATRLSYKSNFINYAFREDMIADAVENCLTYIGNFDPEKSKNPFAYFTQIIYYAFLRKIQKEKKQLYIRYKALENSDIMEDLIHASAGESVSSTGVPKLYDNMREFIHTFEESTEKKKNKTNTKAKKVTKRKSANTPLKFVGETK